MASNSNGKNAHTVFESILLPERNTPVAFGSVVGPVTAATSLYFTYSSCNYESNLSCI